jgi:hypothetical protein
MPAETNVDTTEIEEEEKVKTFKCYECESEFEEDEMQHNDDGDLYCYDCYYETYGTCSECGVETSHDYIQFDERSEEYYCDGCLPHHGEDVDLDSYYSNVNIISPDNNTYVDNKFERAVGVEIETTGFEHSIDDFDCSEFDFKKAYDGSVNANNSEYKGVEYIYI